MFRSSRRSTPVLILCAATWVGCGKDGGPLPAGSDTGSTGATATLIGHRVTTSADLTGDGAPDVVIAAPGSDGTGSVRIFDAALTGELGASDATATIRGSEAGDIGDGLQACGDMNGDGARDLVVGLPLGNSDRGGVWLLSGPFSGDLDTDGQPLVRGFDVGGQAGFTVDCRGDFDNDGLADLIFSAPEADGFGIAERVGQVFFHKSIDGGTDAVASFSSTYGGSQLGYHRSLVLDQDLNGDGLADAVMGAHGTSRLYVLFAPFQGTYDANYAGQTFYGREDLDSTGHSLAVGDLDGDGHPDIATGAPAYGARLGAVGILPGPFDITMNGNIHDLGRWIDGSDPNEYVGHSLAVAPDLSGDGLADLVIGAPGATTSGADAGVVYVVHGPAPGGSVATADAVLVGTEPGAQFGYSVAAVPDVTGDSRSEVLIGAPTAGSGAAYIFHSPLPARAEQSAANATISF